MHFITDYRIEDYILNTSWDDFPIDVKERTLRCSVDLMDALILGSQGKQYEAGVNVAKRIGAIGDAPVFGKADTFNLLGASIVFSHAANSFDIDDGYNMVKGHPGASFIGGILAAALEKHNISMISFSDEELEKLMTVSSYCVPAQITKETYPKMYEDAQSFSIPAIICVNADMDEEFVYNFMVAVFDNMELLAQTHERGADLSLETALDGLDGATLHPGAERFFREKGILK